MFSIISEIFKVKRFAFQRYPNIFTSIRLSLNPFFGYVDKAVALYAGNRAERDSNPAMTEMFTL